MSELSHDLGALEITPCPIAARALAERRELFRIAGQSALDRSRNGRDLSPEDRAWAEHYAAFKPRTLPLSTGETS